MKAITRDRYGSAEVLDTRDIEPEIGDGGCWSRVHAAPIRVGD